MGSKYFLHFDCPLRLKVIHDSKTPRDTQQDSKHEYGAISLNGEFIMERSHELQDLSISRPQNPIQYSDRLTFTAQAIGGMIDLGERCLIKAIWGDETPKSTLFYVFYGLHCFIKRRWVDRALSAFVHGAWMATYQPGWDPNGPWKWFGRCGTGNHRSLSGL